MTKGVKTGPTPTIGHWELVIGHSLLAMSDLRCPVCDQPVDPKTAPAMPFCSLRCKQIDLGRWLGERYSMPIERPHEGDDPPESTEN
jgi:endogenous inhibitor of DNA gyrase (YacG/DUF329 family)